MGINYTSSRPVPSREQRGKSHRFRNGFLKPLPKPPNNTEEYKHTHTHTLNLALVQACANAQSPVTSLTDEGLLRYVAPYSAHQRHKLVIQINFIAVLIVSANVSYIYVHSRGRDSAKGHMQNPKPLSIHHYPPTQPPETSGLKPSTGGFGFELGAGWDWRARGGPSAMESKFRGFTVPVGRDSIMIDQVLVAEALELIDFRPGFSRYWFRCSNFTW